MDCDRDKTDKYNPKAICRHGWLKIQAIKSRMEGIPFRLNYFSRDTVNCYLPIYHVDFSKFFFFQTLIFWKFIFHALIFLTSFFHTLIFINFSYFSHVDFLAKKQHKNQNINDWFLWKHIPTLTGWYKGASLNAHPEWMRI